MYSDFPHLRVLLSPNAVHAAVRYIFLSGYFFRGENGSVLTRFVSFFCFSFVFLLFFCFYAVFPYA